jgi:hypothetical protein
MKKVIVTLLMLNLSCNAMERGKVVRIAARRGGIFALCASALYGLWKIEIDNITVDPLDKEVIKRFYETDPLAKTPLYQQIKKEATEGVRRWSDVLPNAPISNKGTLPTGVILNGGSMNTECSYNYDYSLVEKGYFPAHYDCTTTLRRGGIKQCLRENIQDGRIE